MEDIHRSNLDAGSGLEYSWVNPDKDTDSVESKLRNLQRYDMRFEQTGYVGYEINAEEFEEGDWVKWEDIELILNNK